MAEEVRPSDFFSRNNILVSFLRNEGIRALWKGNVPAEILYVLYGASQFTAYSIFNDALTNAQTHFGFLLRPLTHSFFVGSGAGVAATVIAYPFDLLRTTLAANQSSRFLSMSATCKELFRQRGAWGFFSGLRPSLLSIVANSGTFFWSYSLARTAVASHETNGGGRVRGAEAACGLVAGVTAKMVSFPLDTLRKRVQMSHQANSLAVFASHYRQHGMRGFYRGFIVSLIKNAPTSAISIFVYENTIDGTRRLQRALGS